MLAWKWHAGTPILVSDLHMVANQVRAGGLGLRQSLLQAPQPAPFGGVVHCYEVIPLRADEGRVWVHQAIAQLHELRVKAIQVQVQQNAMGLPGNWDRHRSRRWSREHPSMQWSTQSLRLPRAKKNIPLARTWRGLGALGCAAHDQVWAPGLSTGKPSAVALVDMA